MLLVQCPMNPNMAASARIEAPQIAHHTMCMSLDVCDAILCGKSAIVVASHINAIMVRTSAVVASTTPMASIRHRNALLQLPAQPLIFLIDMYMKNIRYARHTLLRAKAMKRRRRRTSGIEVLATAIANMPLRVVAAIANATAMPPIPPATTESRIMGILVETTRFRCGQCEEEDLPLRRSALMLYPLVGYTAAVIDVHGHGIGESRF